MKTNSKLTVGRTSEARNWYSRIRTWTGILVTMLLFNLLHHPVPAFSATLPGVYSVNLAWVASPSPSVTAYRIYCGTASRQYSTGVTVENTTTNTVSGLAGGVTYFFAVTGININGLESALSNEISYAPGIPALQIRGTASRQFVLTVSGLAGKTYDILATQDFTVWTVIGAVVMDATGPQNFTDTNAAPLAQRFYRTQQRP
jgi:hypothetical protein